jgi:hypothetical protein
MVGFRRLTELCEGLFGLTISQGAISNMLARMLVRRPQERLPPGQSPGSPTILEPCKAKCDLTGASFEGGGRCVLATRRRDDRARIAGDADARL